MQALAGAPLMRGHKLTGGLCIHFTSQVEPKFEDETGVWAVHKLSKEELSALREVCMA